MLVKEPLIPDGVDNRINWELDLNSKTSERPENDIAILLANRAKACRKGIRIVSNMMVAGALLF
jgi:hypothetical protein